VLFVLLFYVSPVICNGAPSCLQEQKKKVVTGIKQESIHFDAGGEQQTECGKNNRHPFYFAPRCHACGRTFTPSSTPTAPLLLGETYLRVDSNASNPGSSHMADAWRDIRFHSNSTPPCRLPINRGRPKSTWLSKPTNGIAQPNPDGFLEQTVLVGAIYGGGF
jgi:hypothetical protein